MTSNNVITLVPESAPAPISTPDPEYAYVENNIKGYIDDSAEHIATLGNLADQSQNPRAYEVLHNFYKVMIEANKQLVDIKKIKTELDPSYSRRQLPQEKSVTNNLFVGSTNDLQRFLNKDSNVE